MKFNEQSSRIKAPSTFQRPMKTVWRLLKYFDCIKGNSEGTSHPDNCPGHRQNAQTKQIGLAPSHDRLDYRGQISSSLLSLDLLLPHQGLSYLRESYNRMTPRYQDVE